MDETVCVCVSLCVLAFAGVICLILNDIHATPQTMCVICSQGCELASKGRELANHFLTEGTPVMIGGLNMIFTHCC